MAVLVAAVELAPAAPARLADREVRRLPLGNLTFGTRKRRANQSPMHRTVIVRTRGKRRFLGLGRFGYCRRCLERLLGGRDLRLQLW